VEISKFFVIFKMTAACHIGLSKCLFLIGNRIEIGLGGLIHITIPNLSKVIKQLASGIIAFIYFKTAAVLDF